MFVTGPAGDQRATPAGFLDARRPVVGKDGGAGRVRRAWC